MYEVNVIGLMQVTQALLPALVASGAGVIVNVGSTAGRIAYEGGGGYTAAKHGTQVVTETLRLELYDQPVRICEIAPGMVKTDEFALVRFDGDQERAESVYAGVAEPLVAEDVADAIAWVVTRPPHVNIDELVIRPAGAGRPAQGAPRLRLRCRRSLTAAVVEHQARPAGEQVGGEVLLAEHPDHARRPRRTCRRSGPAAARLPVAPRRGPSRRAAARPPARPRVVAGRGLRRRARPARRSRRSGSPRRRPRTGLAGRGTDATLGSRHQRGAGRSPAAAGSSTPTSAQAPPTTSRSPRSSPAAATVARANSANSVSGPTADEVSAANQIRPARSQDRPPSRGRDEVERPVGDAGVQVHPAVVLGGLDVDGHVADLRVPADHRVVVRGAGLGHRPQRPPAHRRQEEPSPISQSASVGGLPAQPLLDAGGEDVGHRLVQRTGLALVGEARGVLR